MIFSLSPARRAVLIYFFLNGCVLSSWIPHIPVLQDRLGLSEGLLGLSLFSMAAGAVITMTTTGFVIQRFGSRQLTVLSAAAFCISLPLPVLAPSFIALNMSLFLFGACNGCMDVAMNAQAVIVEKQHGKPIMSSFHGLFSIGGLTGALLGGLVLGFNISPLIHVAFISITLLPCIFLFKNDLVEQDYQQAPPEDKTPVSFHGRLIGIGILAFLVLVAEGSIADWSGVYIKQTLQNGPGFVAAGYAAFSLTMALDRLFGDRFVANIGPVQITRFTSIIAAGGLSLVLLFPTPASVITGFGLVGLGLSNLIPVLFSSAGSIPGVSEGKGIAFVATAGYFGFLAGPPTIGALAHLTTLDYALFTVVAAIVVVTVFAGLTRKR